jgi:hypothetical protein
VHISVQVMVAIGFGLLGLASWFFGWLWARRRVPDSRLLSRMRCSVSGCGEFLVQRDEEAIDLLKRSEQRA